MATSSYNRWAITLVKFISVIYASSTLINLVAPKKHLHKRTLIEFHTYIKQIVIPLNNLMWIRFEVVPP